MNRVIIIFCIVLSVSFIFQSCDRTPNGPEYEKKITVFGFLKGNAFLTKERAILITYTQPIDGLYDLSEAAVTDAVVTLTKNDEERLILLQDIPSKPGFYFNENEWIEPGATYHLTIDARGEIVKASTTVPTELVLTTELSPDSVNDVYQTNLGYLKPIYVECEKNDQIILVDMYCNEPYTNAEYIYPFSEDHINPDNQEEYDGGINGEPRHIQAFMMYRDLFTPNFDSNHVIYWYASMIVFYGSNTMSVLAIDENYHRYLYSENPEYEGGIQGGIGVFGSICGENYLLNVMKEDN